MIIKLEEYTYIFDVGNGNQEIYRNGQLWRNETGDNFILAMAQRIEVLEEAVKEAHRIILHEINEGLTPTLLETKHGGKGFGYFEDLIK